MGTDEHVVDIRGDGDSIQDIWINGYPVGKLLNNAEKRISELENQIEELQDGGANDGVSPEVRSRLLELHQDLIDVREGRLARFDKAANARRAAKIFRRFIRRCGKAAGEHETGIEASYGNFIMTRDRALEAIESEDTLPPSGHSMTVKRTFREAVRRTRDGSCDCDWMDCDHALLQFRKTDSYQLAADQTRLNRYLSSVAELVEEIDATDDPVDPGEDPVDDIADELEKLGSANAVVSRSREKPLAATNGTHDNS